MSGDPINTEFPGNSRRSRVQKEGPEKPFGESPRKLEKVVTSPPIVRKKSLIDRFAETFFGEDAKNVGNYIVWDILLPAAKNTISEMFSSGIEMLLFGSGRERSRSRVRDRDRDRTYISYDRMYRDRDQDRQDDRRQIRRARVVHEFDDIIIESRGEAEKVISLLIEQIEEYGAASIADFYDLVGITGQFTDNKYGWDDLSTARIERVREGYILDLPKPILIR